jgi:ligand-binding sensor domain-containing protein/signal transduction histidine kinase/DNA-binding response OmpR family regulator
MNKSIEFFISFMVLRGVMYCLAVLITCSTALAEPRIVSRYTIQNGLPQSTVSDVLRDRNGFIWVATSEGAARFDGDRFTLLKDLIDSDSAKSKRKFGKYAYRFAQDSSGTIWIGYLGSGLEKYDPETGKIVQWLPTNSILTGGEVYGLDVDDNDKLWLASRDNLFFVAPGSNELELFPGISQSLKAAGSNRILSIEVENDNIWLGTERAGLWKLNVNSKEFGRVKFQNDEGTPLLETTVQRIHKSAYGLLVGTLNNGLFLLNGDGHKLDHFSKSNGQTLGDNEVTSIIAAPDGKIWVGTWSDGVNILDLETKRFMSLKSSLVNRSTLSSNTILSLLLEPNGTVWAGTYDNGLNSFSKSPDHFTAYQADPLAKSGPVANMIWSIERENDDDFWVGTKSGVSYFSAAKSSFLPLKNRLISNDIRALLRTDDALWIGTKRGLEYLAEPTVSANGEWNFAKQVTLKNEPSSGATLSNSFIRLLMKDNQSRIWIGTQNGLNRIDSNTKEVRRYLTSQTGSELDDGSLPHGRIRSIRQDTDGTIWIGTSGGLSRYLESEDKFQNYNDLAQFQDLDIRDIWLDPFGYHWLATGDGIGRINFVSGEAKWFDADNKLPNTSIYNLLSDDLGGLWFTTNNGLGRIDVETFDVKSFDIRNGLLSNEFNFNAALKLTDNHFVVGGVAGFYTYDPERVLANKDAKLVPISVTFSKPYNFGEEIVLAGQESISAFIALHDYQRPRYNSINWLLEGRDIQSTKTLGSTAELKFTELQPGQYKLRVWGHSSSGVASEKLTFPITVPYPFWRTWSGWTLLFVLWLLVATSLAVLFSRQSRIRSEKLALLIDEKTYELQQQTEQLIEINAQRDTFYLHASHELRTPLSLIRAPIEQLLKTSADQNVSENWLGLVKSSVDRLERLVNQMLKVARSGNEKSSLIQMHESYVFELDAFLLPLLRTTDERLSYEGKTLSVSPLPTCVIDLNAHHLESVLINLIDNAVTASVQDKFGEAAVRFDATVEDGGVLVLKIANNGKLFSNQNKQLHDQEIGLDECTHVHGIGLSVVAEAVNALGAEMRVNVDGQVTIFEVKIPVDCEPARPDYRAYTLNDVHERINPDSVFNLLILEDDLDLGEFLFDTLSEKYSVVLTQTLKQAQNFIEEKDVDLILSDIMIGLDETAGFTLGTRVRDSAEHSHIGVIYMTARGGEGDRVAAFDSWADGFVTKPLHLDELMSVIDNFINKRTRAQARLQQLYGQDAKVELRDDRTQFSPIDQQLAKRMLKIMTDNMSDCDFNLSQMAVLMKMSERSLQRKLKILVGVTFSETLTAKRLEFASQLLKQGASVKAAAFDSGYSGTSHFSRAFKKHFGKTPSSIRE